MKLLLRYLNICYSQPPQFVYVVCLDSFSKNDLKKSLAHQKLHQTEKLRLWHLRTLKKLWLKRLF